MHALSSAKGEYAIYLDGNGPTDLSLNLPGGRFETWWVDLRTGAVEARRTFGHKGGPIFMQSPPFQEGIAMRISRREESR